ncbi:hypothetical protein [Salisediminibacterium halotolerans]|uniref:ATP-binding protein n=1 Tax=Salisediminibacterium halotolerans TaxID=517425 RepID=UPI000EB45EFD|nr:hypothetical protein [Salisediminibacterium halotolerans]RLJ75596.1 D-alanine-D-alanine ligase-like ATP-grasp enzyme [Actinophytocola xinjiangensis]RPE89450.1 D-alanine-D-alanine ligase-like ATP-grasp enzyme [Salisediminibacterium halotolerans]TWG36209.1 D-alanine-D-alanine ligase-like ATP-grasp enzyme [Salisediminibacterium halotolerans]GEL08348.1 hypothetical protein SHA02_17640 [Salisediminibacterium halotolerans]
MNEKTLLPQLEGSVPLSANGYTLSMYSVTLEAWRRGLQVTFVNNNRRKSETEYIISDHDKEYWFTVARGPSVSKEAIQTCIHKDKTKKTLDEYGVEIPKGKIFENNETLDDIHLYLNEIDFPIVLKPSDGTGGAGVIANIKTIEEFNDAYHYVTHDLGFSKLIVEKFHDGEDHRLYVMNGRVIGAFKKEPANVIGNGKDSIKKLVKAKNELRTSTPAMSNRPIELDKETDTILKSKGYTLDTIPSEGEFVYLKTKNNVSSGGDPIDVTDEVSEKMKNIAVNAAKAIPDLVHCGVDMIINYQEDTGVVLEVNSRPHITAHLYPMRGKSRDIPKEIIDYYFPETSQNYNLTGPNVYYDFGSVHNLFTQGTCKYFTLPDYPGGTVSGVRYRLTNKLKKSDYNRIKTVALNNKIHGYIKTLQNGEISIVGIGNKKRLDNFGESLRQRFPEVTFKSYDWNKPIIAGFHIDYKEPKHSSSDTPEHIKKLDKIDKTKDGYFPVEYDGPEKVKTNKNKSKQKSSKITQQNVNNKTNKTKVSYILRTLPRPIKSLVKKIK